MAKKKKSKVDDRFPPNGCCEECGAKKPLKYYLIREGALCDDCADELGYSGADFVEQP